MAVIFAIERGAQRAVIAVAVVFSFLPILACCLRAFARRIGHRTLDSSDWTLFAACVVAVSYQGVNIAAVLVGGVGYHFTEIVELHGPEPITIMLKLLIAVQTLWALSLSLCKISILILYSKVFSMKAFIIAAKITAVIIIMWATATILMGFFLCTPFAFNWDQTIPGGHCGDQLLSYRITGSLNLVTDVIVLLLPMPYLYGLNLALYKKLVLAGTFAVGIFTCVVSILRLIALGSIDYSDITFNIPEALIFSGLEPSLAVTLACIPVLQPLLRKAFNLSSTGTATASGKASGVSKSGAFEQLNDDSSQYQLHPMDGKHRAAATTNNGMTRGGTSSEHSSDTEDRPEFMLGHTPGNIVVKHEWRVAQDPQP